MSKYCLIQKGESCDAKLEYVVLTIHYNEGSLRFVECEIGSFDLITLQRWLHNRYWSKGAHEQNTQPPLSNQVKRPNLTFYEPQWPFIIMNSQYHIFKLRSHIEAHMHQLLEIMYFMLKTTKLITRQQVSKNDFELEQNLKYECEIGSFDLITLQRWLHNRYWSKGAHEQNTQPPLSRKYEKYCHILILVHVNYIITRFPFLYQTVFWHDSLFTL
jgi:hypothetical protein